ncbi:MAG TPA: hypothetical protein VJ810_41220, partial [Blastocatellia bacterium]|nr:hypothetical protein [Blastocatellia bacterium]
MQQLNLSQLSLRLAQKMSQMFTPNISRIDDGFSDHSRTVLAPPISFKPVHRILYHFRQAD